MGFQNTTLSQITVLKKQTKSLFIFKVNNNKAPGSIWQLTDRPWPLHRLICQRISARSHNTVHEDSKELISEALLGRGEPLAHNKVRPPTKREKQWPQGEIQQRVGLNTRQVCKYACRCIVCAAGLRQKIIKKPKSIMFTGMLTFWCS